MMYGYDFNGTGGWWMLSAIALVAVAIVVSGWLVVHRPVASGPGRSGPDDILRERFARGEITGEQLDEARKRLG